MIHVASLRCCDRLFSAKRPADSHQPRADRLYVRRRAARGLRLDRQRAVSATRRRLVGQLHVTDHLSRDPP